MPLRVDLSELPHAVRQKIHEVCTNEFTVQATLAKIRQQKIAQFHHNNQGRAIEGIGGQDMALDPFFVNYFNVHHRTSYWEDLDFRDWVKKQFDWARVKTGGTKLQVGYAGRSGGAERKVFTKKY